MSKQLKSIIGNPVTFVETLLKELKEKQVQYKGEIDHVCFRVNNFGSYLSKKKELSQVGTLLCETLVNDRPIATYKLREPVRVQNPDDEDHQYEIPLVELPAPKQGRTYEEKLEHFEIVIHDDLQSFVSKNSHVEFDVSDLSKSINPEVSIKLNSGSVKFHNQSLEKVIELEERIKSGVDPRTLC